LPAAGFVIITWSRPDGGIC